MNGDIIKELTTKKLFAICICHMVKIKLYLRPIKCM